MDQFKVIAMAFFIAGLSIAFFSFDICRRRGEAGLTGLNLGCFFNYSMAAVALCFLGIFAASTAIKKDKDKKKGKEAKKEINVPWPKEKD